MDLNGFALISVPVAVAFVTFVIYGGLIMPAQEMRSSLRHDRPRGPDGPAGGPVSGSAPVIDLPATVRTDRKATA
ncbi:hypothetical protein [Actinomadura harenae]|nr:hypothetical protein [Actinomadura harenae]